MSAAKQLLTLVWSRGKKDSWERINHSMRNALKLAIGSGLSFDAPDFDHFATVFRWSYWVSDVEWIYADAVIYGNQSCIEAFEQWRGRVPFRANDVDCPQWTNAGYIHANSIHRQRERMATNFRFRVGDDYWHVTGFDDAKGLIRVAKYSEPWPKGKPIKLRKLTHDDFTAMCPAQKKVKKPTEPTV